MRKIFLAAGLALTLFAADGSLKAQEVSFRVFYSSLAPYGEWVNTPDYGMGWRPYGVPADWMPYTFGHWVWTDYGWTWVSGYPWGWAPFHYGRWTLDARYGWVWTPGYVWAPAWVQWRWGGGYCGWAPLPPGFHFRVDVVVGPDDYNFGVGMRSWVFVRAGEIGDARYRFVDRDAIPRVMDGTRNVTRFRFTASGVYQTGLPREEVERVARRRIQTVSVVRSASVGRESIVGRSLHIYSPAPIEPRIRSEQEVIRRERAYQAPERIRVEPREEGRARQEMSQPNPRQDNNAPRVERGRENARPGRDVPRKEKDQPRERDKHGNDNRGHGRWH